MVDLAAPILQSLLLGSLYAMMALGLTMTYRVTKVPNFAHAEYVTIGGYMSVVTLQAFGTSIVFFSQDPMGATLQIVVAISVAFGVTAVVGSRSSLDRSRQGRPVPFATSSRRTKSS